MFTIRKIHENGYTDKDFLELIKPLYFMEDREELRRLTASTPKNDFGKFVELMVWLKTEEGIQSIFDAYTRMKNVVMTDEGVALAHKLFDYAAAQRLTRQNIIDEINELTRCLREREKKSSDIDDDLKMNLGPLYAYKEPSLHELRIEAYKLYEDDCKANRISAFPIDHEKGFEIATQKFGDVA
ncbi:MEI1 protein, partial [Trifolium pratense]